MIEVTSFINAPLEFNAVNNIDILAHHCDYGDNPSNSWVLLYNDLLREFVCRTNAIIDENHLD